MANGSLPRILLVGAGSMGSLHARVIAQSSRCSLAGVVEPSEAAGMTIAQRHGTEWRPELGDLSGIDAVVVAAPTHAHHAIALEVLDAGKPLLVEKPVCDGLEETQEVLAFSATRGVPIMCGLLERYNPAIMMALSVAEEPIHVAAVRHGPYAPRIRTGVSWDLLIHDVDLVVCSFKGTMPVEAKGTLGYFHPSSMAGAEDVAEAVMSFPGGGLGTVSASRLGQRKVRSLIISELDRSIEVDLLRRDVTIYRHVSSAAASDDGRGYRQQTVIEIPELMTATEPLVTQLERFLDLIDGRVDADDERASILPAHVVVDQVRRQALQAGLAQAAVMPAVRESFA